MKILFVVILSCTAQLVLSMTENYAVESVCNDGLTRNSSHALAYSGSYFQGHRGPCKLAFQLKETQQDYTVRIDILSISGREGVNFTILKHKIGEPSVSVIAFNKTFYTNTDRSYWTEQTSTTNYVQTIVIDVLGEQKQHSHDNLVDLQFIVTPTYPNSWCRSFQNPSYMCKNSDCVHSELKCDGFKNCMNGDDETECSATKPSYTSKSKSTNVHANATVTTHVHETPSTSARVHEKSSTTARVHEKSSTTARVHEKSSTTARVHEKSSTSAQVHDWPSTSAHVHDWPSTSAHVHDWPSTSAHVHDGPSTKDHHARTSSPNFPWTDSEFSTTSNGTELYVLWWWHSWYVSTLIFIGGLLLVSLIFGLCFCCVRKYATSRRTKATASAASPSAPREEVQVSVISPKGCSDVPPGYDLVVESPPKYEQVIVILDSPCGNSNPIN